MMDFNTLFAIKYSDLQLLLLVFYCVVLKLLLVDLYVGRALSWLMFVHKTSKKISHSSQRKIRTKQRANTQSLIHTYIRSSSDMYDSTIWTLIWCAHTYALHIMPLCVSCMCVSVCVWWANAMVQNNACSLACLLLWKVLLMNRFFFVIWTLICFVYTGNN